MVQDAEKYKAEDDVQRDKVSAKNGLESYAFNMKSTVEDEKLKDKISDEDKQKIVEKCNEVISWLDKNQVLIRTSFVVGNFASIGVEIVHFKFPFFLSPRSLQRKMSLSTSRRSWRSCATPS